MVPATSLDGSVGASEAAVAVGGAGKDAGTRDPFLDSVRAIAVVRVIVWHAFGAAVITYVVAAMPAMFFVTGSLLAKSLDRRRADVVLRDRLRRLLVPLWVFALAAWAAMTTALAVSGSAPSWWSAWRWILPLADPLGSSWEGGWMSAPLWYLRALLWLLLASPVLLWAVRRIPVVAFVVPLTTVVALDLFVDRRATHGFLAGLAWPVGDFALYALFLMVGFLHRDGRLDRIGRAGWFAIALVAAIGAFAWRVTQPVPLGVVNDSHPMHLLVGAAWLALAMAAAPLVALVATHWSTGWFVRAVGRRSLTIYLWHTTAIILAINLLERWHVEPGLPYIVGLLALTAAGTLVAVAMFGWIEDRAAGRARVRVAAAPAERPARVTRRLRPSTPWPARVSRVAAPVAGFAVLMAALPMVLPTVSAATATTERRPAVPSQQPPSVASMNMALASTSIAKTATATTLDPTALMSALVAWANEYGVQGVIAGVTTGDEVAWTGATGEWPDGTTARRTDNLDIQSVTKLFTAAIVLHFVDAGLVDLDTTIGTVDTLGSFPYGNVLTPRMLLEHRSGLVNYRDTSIYNDDPAAIDTVAKAVAASVSEPLLFEPGTQYAYSSTNFLVLGAWIEQVTGQSYDALLHELVLDPLHLTATVHDTSTAGEPNGATSGIVTTTDDLLRAGVGILRDGIDLSNAAYSTLTTTDAEGITPGTFGYCPCTPLLDGATQFTALGNTGGSTFLAYLPGSDQTIVIHVTDSLWNDPNRFGAVLDLMTRISALTPPGPGTLRAPG